MTIPSESRTRASESHPATGRALVAFAAIVTAMVVGLSTLLAPVASATTLVRAQNAVGVIQPAGSQVVGAHHQVLPGQGRQRAPAYDRPASGSCVGAESEGSVAFDLSTATSHLESIDAMTPPNQMMLDRIAEAQQTGRALTSAEQNFLTHETTEAGLVQQGMSLEEAHAQALTTHPLHANYDPEVIKAYPEYFNSNWRQYWGIP